MSSYSVSQLSDHALLRDLAASVRQDRATTATMLAQIAEVDYRKLYRPAAYESMYLYCVHELRMSEETAYRRIRVARTAQKFPAIFDALADGRLHLTAVVLLAPHLKSENSDDLLAMATRKTGHEIEGLLAVRFPKPDVPTFVRPIAATTITPSLAALPVPVPDSQLPPAPGIASVDPVVSPRTEPLAPAPVVPSVPSNSAVHTEPVPSRTKLAPLSPADSHSRSPWIKRRTICCTPCNRCSVTRCPRAMSPRSSSVPCAR